MWNRSELKSNAKLALKANYWKAVLVGLILSFMRSSAASDVYKRQLNSCPKFGKVINGWIDGYRSGNGIYCDWDYTGSSICCHGDQHPAQYFYLESA